MREGILKKFKQELHKTVRDFEKESGGRHNRRPEISAAIVALVDYIDRAQNPLTLLNLIEVYMKTQLSGFIKSMVFRDEFKLRKRLQAVLNQPEYTLQSLSHSVYHESETERLKLYRLIAQLEERLRQLESEKEEDFSKNSNAVSSQEFDMLREKIAQLEAFEKSAQIKIEELENEKWLREREAIALQNKVEELSTKNNVLTERCEDLESDLEEMRQENIKLKQERFSESVPPNVISQALPHLIYQNHSKTSVKNDAEHIKEESCCIA